MCVVHAILCLKYTAYLCKPVKINSLGLAKISIFLISCRHFRSSLLRRAYIYVPELWGICLWMRVNFFYSILCFWWHGVQIWELLYKMNADNCPELAGVLQICERIQRATSYFRRAYWKEDLHTQSGIKIDLLEPHYKYRDFVN